MGALIGGLWAIGLNSDELEKIARQFENKWNMLKLIDLPLFPVSGLIGGYAIRRWLKKYYGSRTFYNVRTPFKVVAYDLVRREELVIESGPIVEAVCQSIAIPGVIKPVRIKDQLIIDGGVLNPLPTNVLAARGIKKIIAVNVLQSPEDVSEGFDMAQHQKTTDQERPFLKAPWQYIKFRIFGALSKHFEHNRYYHSNPSSQ
jgi:NTE family protein